jgi:peptidyl-dipeptidase Dcp
VAKLHAAEAFNQGCQTLEYLSSALVDLEMHSLQDTTALDARALERQILDMLDLPRAIAMRHRSPHFLHVFAGDGYSAGYYSYMWSEVMDADAFMAFEETGDVFDPETAARLAEHVLSAGGREEPDAAYIAFRGRLPGVEALLKGRGLLEVEAAA